MTTERTLELLPIGSVVVGRPWPIDQEPWPEEAVSEIEIDPAVLEALEGLEEFSHIWIVWWLDRSKGAPPSLKVRPEGRQEMPLVGLFATRSPRRPNPIAMTSVRLLAREGTRLRVSGLDAAQGTPVLDIKPYLRRGDCIPEATMARWVDELWRLRDEGK